MENASKALIMAGSVLISMIIIALLVGFFNQLRSLQSTEDNVEKVKQSTEFNGPYEVYNRNVYGSELLSIANKIEDYNRKESDLKDYTKIELEVTFTNNLDNTFFKKGTYNASKLVDEKNRLDNKIKEIGDISVKSTTNTSVSRKISQLSSMRTKDIEDLGIQKTDYQDNLAKYNTYKSLAGEIKQKVFALVEFKYDKNTGRVTKMTYKI